MEKLADNIAESLGLNPTFTYLVVILFFAVAVFGIALAIGGILSWVERRVAGRVQSRVGPNRVGPFGFFQWFADGLKLIMKEDLIPRNADQPMFRLAPYLVVTGVFAAFVSVPFGEVLIAADLNVGILYILAITSLVTVGVLMAGWASNNKWSLLGGVRSAAQIVSYELPSALAILSVVLFAGTLSMQGIIHGQGGMFWESDSGWVLGGWPWNWYVFRNPFLFIAFFIYFVAAIAEGNRTPFDLPEAESELVSGYNTEYSGMRFAGFFLGEFANIYLMSAIITTLFLGGWQVPGVSAAAQSESWLLQLAGLGVFVVKASIGCFIVIWIRWTLPRLRVDQLMALCYKYLVPIGFVCLLGNALLLVLELGSTAHIALAVGTTIFGTLVILIFWWRVRYHIKTQVGDRYDIWMLARGEKGTFDPSVQVRRYGKFRKGEKEAG